MPQGPQSRQGDRRDQEAAHRTPELSPPDHAAGAAGGATAGDAELRRLAWRCRRGLKELDAMLGRFAREALPRALPEERRLFERLLDLPDPVLAGYLLGGEAPREPELRPLAGRIRALCRRGGGAALF
jgi:antitoxin CptB